MKQACVQSASLDQQQQQQHEINIQEASQANTIRLRPNLPRRFLLRGSRENYFKFAVPLYEASIRCDWKAAKAILDKKPELVRYSLTENGETALHVAASAKGPKHVEEFVQNLVDLMKKEDLALENENFNTALYLAAAAGNVRVVKIMVEKNKTLLIIPGAGGTTMPLNAATLFGNYDVVKYLYENSKKLCDDGWNPRNRGWLLEKCVENDMFDIAIQILKEHPELACSGIVLGALARKPDAFLETESNLITRILELVFIPIGSKVRAPKKESEALQLLRIIWKTISKNPKKVIDDIIRGPPEYRQDVKTASDVDQALQIQKHISERLVNMHVEIQNMIRGTPDWTKEDANPTSGMEDQVQKLQKLISEHIAKMHVETHKAISGSAATISTFPNVTSSGNVIKTYPNRILFAAAEMGNTNFVVELIRHYPDLIWKVNDNNQSIFHIAAEHRHEGIYNLLYEIGSMKDLITPLIDRNGSNMLHLVAKIAPKKRLESISGDAFRMQRELLWFKEVEAMVPPSSRKRKNKDGLTPHELFTKEHEDLLLRSEKWMKGTANQCMVVAALVATIVFAAAFTVPGGYNQNDGSPFFYRNLTYMLFVAADAISLFSSSASIIMFIGILTSRFAENDFLESLPKKLLLFLSTLSLSITTMLIAFSISFLVLYHTYLKWMIILVSFAALLVVLIFLLQYSLFIDTIRVTYGSRYLFKPIKHVLYYENPKV